MVQKKQVIFIVQSKQVRSNLNCQGPSRIGVGLNGSFGFLFLKSVHVLHLDIISAMSTLIPIQ